MKAAIPDNSAVERAIERRIQAVQARIDVVAGARSVALVAVSKGFSAADVEAAVAAGCTRFGESYAQEFVEKWPLLRASSTTMQTHFIGRLQRNKVRQIAHLVDVWESVDRASLADEIAKRSPGARVYVQVVVTVEAGKGGCPLDEVPKLVQHCRSLGLGVDGLMTIGPTNANVFQTRDCFRSVNLLADELDLRDRSMGMSGDLEIAIEEGSTHVRIGTAIFGERPRL